MLLTKALSIYPAPAIVEATPAKESTIRSMLALEPSSALLQFTLGNLQFREADFDAAIESYQKSLALELNNALVISNVALAYFKLGKLSETLTWAMRAIGFDRTLALPRLLAALVLKKQKKLKEAEDVVAELLQVDSNISEAYELLAVLARESGDFEKSYRLSKQAFQRDDTNKAVRDELCLRKFEQGKKYFDEGSRIAAYAEWCEGFVHYGASFSECREVVVGMRELAESFATSRNYKNRLHKVREEIRDRQTATTDFYSLFLDFFFTVGLLPEVFEYRHLLQQRQQHWLTEESGEGVNPYAKFRRIVVECYLGNLAEAKDELLSCMDVLPDKKHHSLRLGACYSFISELVDAVQGQLPERHEASDEQWQAQGFFSEFEIAAWRKTGLLPETALLWRKQGFKGTETSEWLRQRISLQDAIDWSAAGYKDPVIVKRWLRGNLSPAQANIWEKVFGGTVDDVIIWLKQGFTDPVSSKGWFALVHFPWVAQQWKDNGFTLQDARGWIAQGIKDPFAALRILRERELEAAQQNDVVEEEPELY